MAAMSTDFGMTTEFQVSQDEIKSWRFFFTLATSFLEEFFCPSLQKRSYQEKFAKKLVNSTSLTKQFNI